MFSWCYSISECFHPENLNEKYIYFAFLIFVVLIAVGKQTSTLIYIPTFANTKGKKKKKKDPTNIKQQSRFSEVEISNVDIPTKAHSSFLAGFATNQCAVTPQPCKYRHICLVLKRREIVCLERGDSQVCNKVHSEA